MTRVLVRIGLALASLAVGLVGAEAVARALHLAPDMMSLGIDGSDSLFRLSDDPLLGYEMKEDFRPVGRPGPRNQATNSHGQRDVERTLARHGPRILLLGDSVVQGIRTPDVEDTISRRLEALLADRGVEVLNFGVSGYGTVAEVELLRTKGLAFDPDLVILVFVENDQVSDHHEPIRDYDYERPAAVSWLLAHSALFRWQAWERNLFRVGEEATATEANQAALDDSRLGEAIEQLAALADEHGFRLAIGVWPTFGDRDVHYPRALRLDLEGDTLWIEALAAKLGVPTFRFADAFQRDYAAAREAAGGAGVEPPVTRYTGGPDLGGARGDGMHPNRLASRIAAEGILEQLEARPELLPEAQ